MKLEKVLEQEFGGWTVLVHTLVKTIQNFLYNANYKIEDDKNKLYIEVDQIKEKHGGLIFYFHIMCEEELKEEDRPEYDRIDEWDDYIERIDGAVSMAEAMSKNICEYCGNPGKLRDRKTRCDKCQAEYEKKV